MVRLNIELTEELQRKLAARAAETGHATPEQYVRELLAADLGDEDPAEPGMESSRESPINPKWESAWPARQRARDLLGSSKPSSRLTYPLG